MADLEYMLALHKISNEILVRSNGSIKATDMNNYLTSRYGSIVAEQDVKLKAFVGLLSSSCAPIDISNNYSDYNSNSENDNNDDNEEEETYLDISEIASTLLTQNLLEFSTHALPRNNKSNRHHHHHYHQTMLT